METNKCYTLQSTGDNRDRKADIEACLGRYSACVLGPGKFYVSGIDMPDHTTLTGLASATQLILLPEIEHGYTVRMGSYCCVQDLTLLGAEEKIDLPETVGERHGILYEGTATTKEWMGPDLKLNSVVQNCRISGYTGGGLTCRDTGYYVRASLAVTNCHIVNCGAGINISHYSEYHKFTNIQCCENRYGCINNGGNNVFVSCGFDANVTGFVIDNSTGQSPNNSHGSVVGCTFNHNDNNKGIGIQILNAKSGYVFTGCQMFYSKIDIDNSPGILFNAMNFGRDTVIAVRGKGLVMLTDCVFHGVPDTANVDPDAPTKFLHCYTRDGDEITL
ncbi:MAG: hypothetical protein IJY50_06180 [Clostridia bacterium]|nr:hypothetical protein [Clostridia bacterium]